MSNPAPAQATITSVLAVQVTTSLEIPAVTLYCGNVSLITCTVVDENGAVQDPGVVTAALQTPDGVVSSQTVTRVSTGVYTVTVTWMQANTNTVIFSGTSPYPFNAVAYFKPVALPFTP